MENKILDGENVKPRNKKDALNLIGIKVIYLRECDIDKSGRGYFFPKNGVIVGYVNRQIEFDDGNFIPFSAIVEMQISQ